MSLKNSDNPIVVEQEFESSPARVWNAITSPAEMRQWYFDNIPSFEAVEGFETRFIIENEGRVFPHLWKITEVVPFKKLNYDWSYEGYKGKAIVSFELFEEEYTSRLRLTFLVLEDFQEDIPEFTRSATVEGWKYFIQGSLKYYLDR